MCIGEDRSDILFVYCCDMFFGLAVCGVGEGSENIESGFCSCVGVF